MAAGDQRNPPLALADAKAKDRAAFAALADLIRSIDRRSHLAAFAENSLDVDEARHPDGADRAHQKPLLHTC
jgi:hypothetical protein